MWQNKNDPLKRLLFGGFDAFLVPLDAKERPILLDIIEDRHERKSIVLASQLPVDNWYDAIGDPAVADAVLNRIVHTAHRIELTGESVRKMKIMIVTDQRMSLLEVGAEVAEDFVFDAGGRFHVVTIGKHFDSLLLVL